jgi:hypothetical protein
MKKKFLKFGLIFLIAIFVVFACKDSTSSDNPVPGQVILVDKTAEDDSLETGIDAEHIITTERDGIILQWHPITDDNDLVAYDIYRSERDSSSGFAKLAEVNSPVGNIDTFYFDTSLVVFPQAGAPAPRYYYYVRARDAENQQGPHSRVDNYRLEEICTLLAPNEFTQPFDGNFHWRWPTSQPDSFVFRLLKEKFLNIYKVVIVNKFQNNEFNPEPFWSLSNLGLGPLETGTYRWRIDIIGTEVNNGSESEWSTFGVQ